MKGQFTKGDWSIDNSYSTFLQINVKHEKNSETAICAVECDYEELKCDYESVDVAAGYLIAPTDEQVANAHLIAAAPMMYRMLDAMAKGEGFEPGQTIERLLAEARGEK